MADPNVKMQFFGDEKDAQRALVALEKKFDTLQNKVKQTSRVSQRGSKESSSGFRDASRSAMGLIGQLGGVTSATAILAKAWSNWSQEIQQAEQNSKKFTRNLIQELTLAGDLAAGPKIREFLQNIPGITEEQGLAAFAGVRGGGPALPRGRVMALSAEAARAGPLIGDDQIGKLGELMGRLAQVAPAREAGDVADLATAVRAAAGARLDQVTTPGFQRATELFVKAGTDPETAIATVLQAVEKGIRPSTLATIAEKVTPAVGIRKLLADPELAKETLGADRAKRLSLVELDKVLEQAGELRKAQVGPEGGLLGRQLRDARELDEAAAVSQDAAAKRQKTLRPFAESQRRVTALRESEGAGLTLAESINFTINRGFSDFMFNIGTQLGLNQGLSEEQLKALMKNNTLLERQNVILEGSDIPTGRVNRNAQSE